MDTRSQPVLIKIALIGEKNSGKSALVTQLMERKFSGVNQPTIGVQIHSHQIDSSVSLQIFDTSGDNRLITPFNFSHLHTVFITCDLTNAHSLNSIDKHLERIKKNNIATWPQQIILVGTKADLHAQRQIDENTFSDAARGFNLPYIETSALSNLNVNELFQLAIKHWQPHLTKADHAAVNDIVPIKPIARSFFKDHQNIIAYTALFLAIIAIIVTLSTGLAAPLIGALMAVGVGAVLAAIITHTVAFVAGLLGGALLGTATSAMMDILPWRRKKSTEPTFTPPTTHTSATLLKNMGGNTHREIGKGVAYESELLGHSAQSDTEEPSIHSSNEIVDIESLSSTGSVSPR